MIRRSTERLDGRDVARVLTGPEDELRAALAAEALEVGPVNGLAAPILRGGVRVGRLAVATEGPSEARIALALDWQDPQAVGAWLRDLRSQVADLAAAAEDQTRPPAQRELGRAAARRAVMEARSAVASLFRYAGMGAEEDGGG